MSYPASSDVTSGQATLASQYNNLRADALRFSQASADAVNLGEMLGRYSSWVRLEYLATNKIRVPYSAGRPPALMVNGYLLKASANVDSSTVSGSAGARYVFANRTAASTTFTITVSTSASEGTDQRLIGSFYFDGSNIDRGSIKSEELESPTWLLAGTDAEKSASPAAGDVYIATDTQILYACFTAGAWVTVGGALSARAKKSAAQSISDSTQTAVTFNQEDFDTSSFHDTSSNTSRMTAPQTGTYLFVAQIEFAANATGNRWVNFRLNGATVFAATKIGSLGAATSTVLILVSIYNLTAGDYVETLAYQSSGGALNVDGYFMIAKL